ncbi:MAG: hypothetical protein IMF11_09020 [Proteobacteria bacterium]|nr:hypothetical protein [Pseudomonadota bacterium]
MFKAEDLQKFFDKSPGPRIGFKATCHDCGEPICIKMDMDYTGKVTVKGGALYSAQVGPTQEDKAFFLKCDACFKKDPVLRNFQPCEVYSRVIGYLRPVGQWNDGKQAEFKLRSTFKV